MLGQKCPQFPQGPPILEFCTMSRATPLISGAQRNRNKLMGQALPLARSELRCCVLVALSGVLVLRHR